MKLAPERLIAARLAKGYEQDELAERMSVSSRAIQGWESGEFGPKGENLRRLTEVLGVSIAYLRGMEELPTAEALKDDSPKGLAESVKSEAVDYLRQVMDGMNDNVQLLSWVLVELKRKFPLIGEGIDIPELEGLSPESRAKVLDAFRLSTKLAAGMIQGKEGKPISYKDEPKRKVPGERDPEQKPPTHHPK